MSFLPQRSYNIWSNLLNSSRKFYPEYGIYKTGKHKGEPYVKRKNTLTKFPKNRETSDIANIVMHFLEWYGTTHHLKKHQ
jgi:hypothetical protein